MIIQFELDNPPSKKNRWSVAHGRIYTPYEVKKWMKQARAVVKEAVPEELKVPIESNIVLMLAYYGKKDLDNVLSTICDMLQGVLIKNDKQVACVQAVKFPMKAEKVTVIVGVLNEV